MYRPSRGALERVAQEEIEMEEREPETDSESEGEEEEVCPMCATANATQTATVGNAAVVEPHQQEKSGDVSKEESQEDDWR
eukprot:COSAG02_NODE_1144_length_14244_cov_16.832096_17_plen_81_part_00